MDRAFDLLSGVLQKRGMSEHALGAMVVHRAQQWIDEQLPATAPLLHVAFLKDAALSVRCDHSVAMQECTAAIPLLLSFLQESCPGVLVSFVRLVRS